MGPSWLLATTASEKHRQRQELAFLTLNVAFVPTDHGLDIADFNAADTYTSQTQPIPGDVAICGR